jgi:Sulfotransferase family
MPDSNGAPAHAVPGQFGGPAKGPVIVLAFRFSGVSALASILTEQPGLTCTSGTGIIPVCAQAIATWQQVEDSAVMSSLAATSVRGLAGSMITCILAAAGGTRWCDIVMAPASSAHPFARLFPQAQFVCLHRACDQVVLAATHMSRWGLASTGIADFAGAYPGNNVAAVAAYWRASTSALLEFEAAHSSRCLRVRHEDLTASPEATTSSILEFLGLPGHQPDRLGQSAEATGETAQAELPGAGAVQQIPLELIPAPMLERVNDLHAQLGYPALMRPPDPQPNLG